MHINLKLGSLTVKVPNVTLQDGYRPMVDGVPPSASTADGSFHIESALWYKTILLDSVYIDCDDREVYWLRKESTIAKTIDDECESQRFVPVGSETLHSDVDVYDFDPTMDELADRANECMTLYTEKKITWDSFRSEVTRILHCYIFPAIKFNKDDIGALQDALRQVEGKSQLVEAEILKKSNAADQTENSLQQLRTRILGSEKFDSELYVRSCRKEFLSLLYKDVEKDITRLNSELEGIQLQVNRYRDCNVLEGTKLKLQDLRKKRDELYELSVSMQVVRETLRNVLYRPPTMRKKKSKKIKVKENVFHEIYLEISKRLQLQKDDLQRACLAKVKISSVREAVFAAFSELQSSDGEVYSVRFTDGSEFSLDIIGFNTRPDGWKTLEEKVYSLLQDCKSEAYHKHHQACKMIMDKVESAIDDTRMFGESTERAEGLWEFGTPNSLSSIDVKFVESVGGRSRKRREGHSRSTIYRPELADEVDAMSVEALKKSLERIRDDIKSQMESMCHLLIRTIPECEKRHKNKLWVSYENVFYLEILPHLCNLYELTHASKSINLFRKISSLTLHDLLDDNFLNIILSGIEAGIHLSSQPRRWRGSSVESEEFEILSQSDRGLSRSCVSLEIRKCTLEQLYSMADRECHQLDGSIPNMFDAPGTSPPVSELSDVTGDDDTSYVTDSEIDEEAFTEEEQTVDPRELLGEMFSDVKQCLQASFKAKTILEKLRRLTKVFRCLGGLLSDLNKNGPMACCDEMLSMIIVLLRCVDEETFVRLYASVMLMIDLRAPFLNGSVHDCSLTNFFGAFDYLFSTQLCKNSELTDSLE